MNNNEFEYSEKTKRRVRVFKRILSFIVLILAIATMVALFYVKKEKMRVRLFFSLLQYIAMSIVLISPRLLKKFANFEVPVEVHISVTAFAFLGLVLGDGLNLGFIASFHFRNHSFIYRFMVATDVSYAY